LVVVVVAAVVVVSDSDVAVAVWRMELDMAQSANWSDGQRPTIAFLVEYGVAFVLEIVVSLLDWQRLGAASSRH